MRLSSSIAALVLVIATSVQAQGQLTINTPPRVTQCQPVSLTWSGGTPPYFLSVLPAGQTTATAIENLGQQQGTDFTWNVDLPAGQSITLSLSDSTGTPAFSSIITIMNGTSTSCLNGGSSSGSSGAAAPTSAASGPTATGTGTASGATSLTVTAPNSSASSGATKPSGTSSSGSGSSAPPASASATGNSATTVVTGSAAGIVGMLIAAILA